jgi:hypothetical protein
MKWAARTHSYLRIVAMCPHFLCAWVHGKFSMFCLVVAVSYSAQQYCSKGMFAPTGKVTAI